VKLRKGLAWRENYETEDRTELKCKRSFYVIIDGERERLRILFIVERAC